LQKKKKKRKKRTVEKEPNMGNEKIKAQQWRERERKKHSCIWKWKVLFHDTHTYAQKM